MSVAQVISTIDDANAESAKVGFMKRIWPKLVILAILCSPIPSWAGNSAVPSIRNCTGCHGTGAQGYTVAPRLAGQRALYIESQPRGYTAHFRDNQVSKQYMWSAAANLDTDAVRDLADYFASLPPRSAHDGRRALVERDKRFTSRESGSQYRGMRRLPRPGRPGCARDSASRRNALFLPQAPARGTGPRNHSAVGSPMPLVVGTLGPDEIEALASYLSFVK
jgi:cytochrome c553